MAIIIELICSVFLYVYKLLARNIITAENDILATNHLATASTTINGTMAQ